VWTYASELGQGPVASPREYGTEPSGSIKCGKFIHCLSYR
jgi:hypothetical protein